MGNVIGMNPCDPSVDKILWLDHLKLTKPQDCGKCNLYLRICQWSYFDDEYKVHFFVSWFSVKTALGQACPRPQDSGESGLKKVAHKPGGVPLPGSLVAFSRQVVPSPLCHLIEGGLFWSSTFFVLLVTS